MRWSWLDAATPGASHVAGAQQAVSTPGQHYSFAWRISGDRAVAPLQVFDDGQTTWLQFAESQAVPAIFASSIAGQQLLDYTRQGPYVVLPGVWDQLVLRGGSLLGRIQRISDVAAPGQLSAAQAQPVEPADALSMQQQATSLSIDPPVQEKDRGLSPNYHASPQDITMRAALSKWAQAAGWTFEPEHWVVDVDIPLSGSASFEPDFKAAVRSLLATTELGDRPLQPCFYANNVLRIVPYAQACDRSVGAGRTS